LLDVKAGDVHGTHYFYLIGTTGEASFDSRTGARECFLL